MIIAIKEGKYFLTLKNKFVKMYFYGKLNKIMSKGFTFKLI